MPDDLSAQESTIGTPATNVHWWALGCFVLLLGAYLSTLPTTLTDADAGEFLVIAKTGGIAHPPGYPIFTGVGRLLALGDRLAPLVTLIAGFSALCVALAGAFLVPALSRFVGNSASAFAVMLVMLSPEVWRQANAAEPFALNVLLAAGLLSLSVRLLSAPRDAPMRRVLVDATLVGLCLGCGLANHHTLALLVPLPVAVLLTWRRDRARLIRGVACMMAGFVAGALPIFTLLAADQTAPLVYGDWTVNRLAQHVLRADYGSLRLSATHDAYWESLLHFVRGLPVHLVIAGPLLAVVGMVRARTWGVTVWMALLTTTVLVVPVFLGLMNIPPVEEPVVVARFFALPMVMLAPWIAAGVHPVVSRVRDARIAMSVMLLVIVAQGVLSRRVSNRATEQVYEAHVRQMLTLASRPDVQMLVSASDLEDYGLTYGQVVLGLAPRASVVMLGPMRSAWYQARIVETMRVPKAVMDSGAVSLLELLNTRGPLFVVDAPEPPRPSMFARARPLGGLLVVVPDGAATPTSLELYEANRDVMNEMSIVPPATRTTPLTGWETRILEQHRERWREVCSGLRADGHQAEASTCDTTSRVFDGAIQRLGTMRW